VSLLFLTAHLRSNTAAILEAKSFADWEAKVKVAHQRKKMTDAVYKKTLNVITEDKRLYWKAKVIAYAKVLKSKHRSAQEDMQDHRGGAPNLSSTLCISAATCIAELLESMVTPTLSLRPRSF
jgi:hypothetical protein